MEHREGHQTNQQVVELLQTACTKSVVGNYGLALSAIRQARKFQPDNSYVAAIEEQIEMLLNLSQQNQLSVRQKKGILQALSVFSKYATEEAQQEVTSQESADVPVREQSAQPSDAERSSMERLKCQYFENAGNFLEKGSYVGALTEIRRIYVIDPNNSSARDFEKTILELMALHQGKNTEASAPPSMTGKSQQPAGIQSSSEGAGPQEMPPSPASTIAAHHGTDNPEKKSAAASEEGAAAHGQEPPIDELKVASVDTHTFELISNATESAEPSMTSSIRDEYPAQENRRVVLMQPENETAVVTGEKPSHIRPAASQQTKVLSLVLAAAFLGWGGDTVYLAAHARIAETNHAPVPLAKAAGTAQQRIIDAKEIAHHQESIEKLSPAGHDASAQHESSKERGDVAAADSIPEDTLAQHPATSPETALENVTLAARTVSDLGISANVAAVKNELRPLSLARKEPAPTSVQAQTPAPQDVVYIEKQGEVIQLERPQLPVGTKDGRFLGHLLIRVRIDAQGKPLQAEVLKSSNKTFDVPMVNAVMKSQFKPAQTSVGPVASWLVIPVNLEDF